MATISKTALYFKQVASVIGEEAAEIELQNVIDSGCDFYSDCDGDNLPSVFLFGHSPQGFGFWNEIADKCGAWGAQGDKNEYTNSAA